MKTEANSLIIALFFFLGLPSYILPATPPPQRIQIQAVDTALRQPNGWACGYYALYHAHAMINHLRGMPQAAPIPAENQGFLRQAWNRFKNFVLRSRTTSSAPIPAYVTRPTFTDAGLTAFVDSLPDNIRTKFNAKARLETSEITDEASRLSLGNYLYIDGQNIAPEYWERMHKQVVKCLKHLRQPLAIFIFHHDHWVSMIVTPTVAYVFDSLGNTYYPKERNAIVRRLLTIVPGATTATGDTGAHVGDKRKSPAAATEISSDSDKGSAAGAKRRRRGEH